ncbi:MAG: cation acetate symporter, partial [Planctomycetota bacterium]
EIAVVRVLGSQTVAQALQERGFTDATKASHPTSDQDYWFAQNADDHQILFIDTQLDDKRLLLQCQYKVDNGGGYVVINGVSPPKDPADPQPNFLPVGHVTQLPDNVKKTGPVGPIEFFRTLRDSRVMLWSKLKSPPTFPADVVADDGSVVVYQPRIVDGTRVLRPGEHPKFAGIRNEAFWPRMNFLSLMIALFCGTASLPHILIRYYTVKDGAAARKSTIVGIATIGFFYVLTLYLGLGAMTSGSMDVTNSNMTAPLLARSIGEWMFAIISAIAFTTVLGTVSGLILASAGAVSHDILKNFVGMKMEDDLAVRIAKIASVIVGSIAICLGILFENMNVGYLVGWAFSVAASSNLPALVMLLFWRGTTRQGIIAGMLVGMISSLGWILLSSDTFNSVYNVSRPEILDTLIPFSQPGIVTIPLSFLVLIGVSLMTREKQPAANG